MGSKAFNGEVWTNVHPELMEAMYKSNAVPVDGKVGNDGYSQRAQKLVTSRFSAGATAVMTFNGTAANVLALKAMLDPWGSVLCAADTHVNTYECHAPEYNTGAKLLAVPSDDGKLTPEMISDYLESIKNFKYIPQVLVLTQPTELGVLYTLDELEALAAFAHSRKMQVYVDGARVVNALAALNTDLKTMFEDTGVDAFSFGGTKAGMMFGEMVVFLRPEHAENITYLQKQSMQHFDKSKFMGVQFEYLLESGLWRRVADHANGMAKLLERRLAEKGLSPAYPVDTNMVFVSLAKEQFERVTSKFDLHYWNEKKRIVRFCMTHETTAELIDELMELM